MKIVLLVSLILGVLSLSACQVNWFGSTVDAPWYVVVPPTVLFIAVVGGFAYWRIYSYTYICPHCSTEIKPKWYQFSFCVHLNGKRLAKCPHCGRKGFCAVKKK
jgi:uncharacterized membrane-anchored protein